MEEGSLLEAIAQMRAAYDTVAACSADALTHPELLTALSELETLTRQLPTQSHRLLARLQREASPVELGAKSLKDVLKIRLRISAKDASRRLEEATDLGSRVALNGEPLQPKLDKVAHAQAQGRINAEHVAVIRGFFAKLPGWVDHTTREKAQTDLTRIASGSGPDELRKAAQREATL
ncbi:MAG: DUF222 domain-containing protein, partial [Mycobacterium sp.]